jgi:hypothetical protein
LLQEAIAYYKEILTEYAEWKPKEFVASSSLTDLKEKLEQNQDITTEERQAVADMWNKLDLHCGHRIDLLIIHLFLKLEFLKVKWERTLNESSC